MSNEPNTALLSLTAEIVASQASNNHVTAADVPDLIKSVHAALARLGSAVEVPAPVPQHPAAITARKSLADPAVIISMIDGKPYKMLKRHLATHGLTPAEYRARYGLPASYPMTAPAYSATRSEVAKSIGLGRKAETPEPASTAAPKRRGRKPAALSDALASAKRHLRGAQSK